MDFITQGLHAAEDVLKGARALVDPSYAEELIQRQINSVEQKKIAESHRFKSFAQQREGNVVKWHIVGKDYFWAVSEMLDSATECIFILDWWLSPELYLRRPPAVHEEWRLDRLLQRKAQQGVHVYICVYNEVPEAASQDSEHTQKALEALHPNIHVMRHPPHLGLQDDVLIWTHHEKVVVVDNQRACIGGLDLCFGRWDTYTHPLVDVHPTEFEKTLFPGQDYNNARYADFHKVNQYLVNEFSLLDQPRMPWEDLHMTITGPVVLDITQHFIERWNFVKMTKYLRDTKYEWLAFPHDIQHAANEPIQAHPLKDFLEAKGHKFKYNNPWESAVVETHKARFTPEMITLAKQQATYNVQVVRSVAPWSHGVAKEQSIQNAYIQLIEEAKHFIYIENQFFISNTGTGGPVVNRIAEALVQRILRAAREKTKFRVIVVIPEVPGFAGSVQSGSISTILAGQYRTINRGGHSIYEELQKSGVDPLQYIRFYHLRNYDRINGPVSLIDAMEKKSGVSYDQAEVALSREWLGQDAEVGGERIPAQISVKEPSSAQNHLLPMSILGNDAISGASSSKDVTKTIDVPKTYQEAQQIVDKFENSAPRKDDMVADTVSQHLQEDTTALTQEQWMGSPEEEANAFVSEEIYIHTKCMIVDDLRVILGSANLNDRSQKGDGDSEIALVVEDQNFIPSEMDGQPYQAASFAATLRRKIFRKHLGLIPPQFSTSKDDPVTSFMRPVPYPHDDESRLPETMAVLDPLDDDLFSRWNDQAKTNRAIYSDLFRTVPCDAVLTKDDLKTYLPSVKPGHLADPTVPLATIKSKLEQLKGHLVEAPLDFLKDDADWTSDSSFTWSGNDPALPLYI